VIEEIPFVNVHRFLRAFTDAVPEIYYHDEARGLIYLEDLGDTLFESVVAGASDEARRTWYGRALDLLLRLQTEGTRRLDDACVASKSAFTETLFLWEFEHFIEYGLGTKTGREIPARHLAVLREAFAPIARGLAAEPRVFTHRDFQSKNLLVQGSRLRLIDFQDALRGPRTYDLVALLRDSYVELSPALLEALVDDYLARARETGFETGRDDFREAFARMTLQRKLKDYGRFVYIDRVRGNPDYLRYNPANARYILTPPALPGLGEARGSAEALGPDLSAARERRPRHGAGRGAGNALRPSRRSVLGPPAPRPILHFLLRSARPGSARSPQSPPPGDRSALAGDGSDSACGSTRRSGRACSAREGASSGRARDWRGGRSSS
jgi:aminoglycoside/choline kinase family phosphotransferase